MHITRCGGDWFGPPCQHHEEHHEEHEPQETDGEDHKGYNEGNWSPICGRF